MSVEEKVENLIKDKIEEIDYELYDVEYAKEGSNYFLRIYIDKENGIGLEDCEKVNNAIVDVLDEADYIKEQYFLEVSSTGIEKTLKKDKHLQRHINEEISIKLFKKNDSNKKEHVGVLLEFNEEYIKIKEEVQEVQIERKNISQIKSIYKW